MRKVKDSDITSAVSSLKVFGSKKRGKYYRNYRRYNYTPFADLENVSDPSVVGYYEQPAEIEEDTTNTPQINIIKSCRQNSNSFATIFYTSFMCNGITTTRESTNNNFAILYKFFNYLFFSLNYIFCRC